VAAQPLRRVLTIQSLTAILLPFGLALLFGFLWIPPQIRKDAVERQTQLALAVGMQVESHLETGAAIVRAAAAMPRESRLAQHGYQRHLDTLLASTDTMSSLYVVAPGGQVEVVALNKLHQAHQKDLVSLNLSRNPLFGEVVRNNRPLWSKTFLSVITGGLAAAYGVPSAGATVIGEVDLALLTKFLRQISTEKDLFILIIDHNGQVVADNNGRYTAQQLNIGNIPLVRAGIERGVPASGQFDFEGHTMTGSIIQIPSVDWHVMVARTDASLYRTSRNLALIVLAGILVALLSGLMMSVYLARKLASRFDELTRHAKEIAQGGSGDWPTSSIDEFNQLSGNLQQMAGRLEENRRFLEDLIEYSGMIIAIKSPEGRYEMVNRKWQEVTGLARCDVLGRSDEELFPALIGAQFRLNDLEAIENDACIEKEEVFDTVKSGRRYALSIKFPLKTKDGKARGICVMSTDITGRKLAEEERLSLEQQMLHVQKLESLGVLAGGIAHDFNNILMAIIGNADLAMMKVGRESAAATNLLRIEQAATQAADLAKQMLAYSGKGKFVVEAVDLNRLLEEVLHLLEVSISKNAVLSFELHRPLPPVEADTSQMRQIVMNLIINASEALGDKSGSIAVATGCLECDRNYLKDVWLDENIAEGFYVYLEVADTGCGMDKETAAKLFDPFFSTKFTGRGLGMAAVLGIVRGHKGAIMVKSEPHIGTTFRVLLPAVRPKGSVAPGTLA
jgi:PAS domain S-box-containing protein